MNDRNVWAYIEGLPGQAAPWCEWRFNLEKWAGFQTFQQRYLKLTSDRAMAIECPTDCGLGCPRKVVEHAVNDIVAVCPEQEEPPLRIKCQDILIYKVNQSNLHKDICSVLGIEHQESKVGGCRHTWRLGDFISTAGMVFPVFLTQQECQDSLAEEIQSLCLQYSNPFILIAPTRKHLREITEKLLEQRKSIFIALNEEMVFSEKFILRTKRSQNSIFSAIINEIPEPDSGGMIYFRTPAGISWKDVRIKFIDGHTVSIRAGTIHGRYNYTQMGLANKRNGNPTIQWELLKIFAKGYGQLDWSATDAHKRWSKQKELLSQRLRNFFRFDQDPIEWRKKERRYICLFRIIPENEDDDYFYDRKENHT